MRLLQHADGFDLFARDALLLRHRSDQPCFYVGAGEPSVRMNKGHFKISDYVTKRIPLQSAVTSLQGSTWHIVFAPSLNAAQLLRVEIKADAAVLQMRNTSLDPSVNGCGAAGNSCHISICAGAASCCGHRSRATAATSPRC